MNTRALFAALILAASPALILPLPAAAEPPVYTDLFSDVAVQGYDPVAYFTAGKPIKGEKAFTAEFNGATFRFVSAANRDAFLADPEKYAPQYGGYCAWAVSQGYHAKGDARFWKIVDGKLYLNYSASVQKKWEGDIPGFIAQADKAWPEINR
jgi:YHS domain-containing protein